MSDDSPVTTVDGKIVKKWQHEAPKARIVAWCPHCLTYGGPTGIDDRVCGNCGKDGCRMYQEVIAAKQPGAEGEG